MKPHLEWHYSFVWIRPAWVLLIPPITYTCYSTVTCKVTLWLFLFNGNKMPLMKLPLITWYHTGLQGQHYSEVSYSDLHCEWRKLLILILPDRIEATQQVGLAPASGMELPVQDRPDTPGFVQRSPCLFQLGSEIINWQCNRVVNRAWWKGLPAVDHRPTSTIQKTAGSSCPANL